MKSIAINSIALAGFTKTFAYRMLRSIRSGVVVVSSNTNLYSVIPNFDFASAKITSAALDRDWETS